MVYLQQVSGASVNVNKPLLVENLAEVSEANQLNPIVDRLTFDELIEMAGEYLEIDSEIKRAKERKLKIWGQDKYLSKPLGSNVVEREQLSAEVLKSIDKLQCRKDYIEYVLYSNRDNILSNIHPEILRNKIDNQSLRGYNTRHRPYYSAVSNESNSNTAYDDSIRLPEFVIRKFQATYRRVASQISGLLASSEAIISEFKRLFIKGNVSKESRILAEILIEHKRSYLNTVGFVA